MNARMHHVLLATAALLLVGTIGAITPVRQAGADVEIDVSIFYSSLAPHGEWVNVQPYGWAWSPDHVESTWRPYTMGHWAWAEPYGWTWISDEPWGWATYHYGRWTYEDDYGWVWVPGTVWAPAWVAFRYGDPWVGWAPLPPGPSWRVDAGFDVAGVNLQVGIGAFAWSFVATRFFAEPQLHSHVYAAAYNPYLVQHADWSTRYTPVDGGIANLGVDLATIERARGAAIPRRRFRDVNAAPDKGGAREDGDAVVVYRPRLAPKTPTVKPPTVRRRGDDPATPADPDAWAAQRKAALKAHLEAERKALEKDDVTPPPPATPKPGLDADDVAKRRAAALKVLEDERKRLEALIERQRLRREKEKQRPPTPPAGMADGPAGMGDDHGGMGEDEAGMDDGHGMK